MNEDRSRNESCTRTKYTYDYNGNTLTKSNSSGITQYAWDFENRLASVTLPNGGGVVTFKYDPFGRRIYKSSNAGTSAYAYDDKNLIEEANVSGALVARYVQSPKIDEPLAASRGGVSSFHNADGLGSITSLADPTGSLVRTYTFDSFGNLTASSGSLTNPFQYTAREFDTETNIYYYRARYYDRLTSRFISEDPAGLRGGLNLYRYAKNDPITLADPSGLAPCGSVNCLRATDEPFFGTVCFYSCFSEGSSNFDIGFAQIPITHIRKKCPGPLTKCPYYIELKPTRPIADPEPDIVTCIENPI